MTGSSSASIEGRGLLLQSFLAAIAGFVDAAGVSALFGLYPAHLTGNLVMLAGASVWQDDPSMLPRLLVVPAYFAAVALAVMVADTSPAHGLARRRWLLGMLGLMLASFAVLGLVLDPSSTQPDSSSVIITACLGVGAMGVQNVVQSELFPNQRPTTVMTGNLTQLITQSLRLLSGRHAARQSSRTVLVEVATLLCGFATGAALGAMLTHLMGLASVALPALLVLMATLLLRTNGAVAPTEPSTCQKLDSSALDSSRLAELPTRSSEPAVQGTRSCVAFPR